MKTIRFLQDWRNWRAGQTASILANVAALWVQMRVAEYANDEVMTKETTTEAQKPETATPAPETKPAPDIRTRDIPGPRDARRTNRRGR